MKLLLSLLVFLTFASTAYAVTILPASQGGTGWGFPGGIQAHTVILGNGLSPFSTTSPSSAGFVLTSNGVNADPTFQASSGGSSNWFTPQSYGNSTSTTIGFLAGLFSVGSTTISSLSSGIVANNNGLLYSFSTSTLTPSSPLTGSFATINGGSLGCQTASSVQAGCLASADFSSFNNRLSTSTVNILSSAGLFFSTTSASFFSSAGLAFSTTSNNYYTSVGLAFSTTSNNVWAAAGLGFSTTSASFFSSLGLAFSTSSANYNFITNLAATTSVKSITTLPTLSLPYSQLTGTPTIPGYPFFPSTFGINVSATTTAILDYQGLITATSTVGTLTASSSITDQPLATPAGTFVAADPTGKLIATTTPSGSNSAFSPAANYATTGVLPSNTYNNGASGVGATLTEVGTGALSVDGGSPAVGQRVLIKNEATAANNGLYLVTAAGSGIAAFILTRDTAYNSSGNIIPGIVTYVISGATLSDDFWAMTSAAPITVGTTGLTYVEVSGGGSNVVTVSNSDSTLTISPTAGNVIASLNLTHANIWSGLQTLSAGLLAIGSTTFNGSATTTGSLYVMGSTTLGTTLSGAGLFTCNGASNALTWNAGAFGCNTISASSGVGNWFAPAVGWGTANATSTLTGFNLGLYALASSTIGNGLVGLTVSGPGTTTGNAYFGASVGIGTSSPPNKLTIVQTTTGKDATGLLIDGQANAANADIELNGGTNATAEANIDYCSGGTCYWQSGIQNNSTNDYEFWDNSDDPVLTIKQTTNAIGVATTTPFGLFAIDADYGDSFPGNLLFNIASSSLTATTSLFAIDNRGQVISTSRATSSIPLTGVVSPGIVQSFTYSTSTAWTGSTTIALEQVILPLKYIALSCKTNVGTLNVNVYSTSTISGTFSAGQSFSASTTNNLNVIAQNNSFGYLSSILVDIGTPASSPTRINCTVLKTLTPQ